MKKSKETLEFNLPENISISIPQRYAEGFREQIINLIYQYPEDVIKNFQHKKTNAPGDVMKTKYLSSWTNSYIKQINESENKEQYISFLINLIQDMDKEVFLSNIEELDKLREYSLVNMVIESKMKNYFFKS